MLNQRKPYRPSGRLINAGGILVFTPNSTFDYKGYYISYNSRDSAIYGSDTTALVIGQMERFYILTGDHVEEYQKCSGLDECLAYFKAHQSEIAKYSDNLQSAEGN